jgi:hypothetical protein
MGNTYYSVQYGSCAIKEIGEFETLADAEKNAEPDDLVLTGKQLMRLGSSVDKALGVHLFIPTDDDDITDLPAMGDTYDMMTTVQFVTNKAYAKKLVSFFYSDEWKAILSRAIGAVGAIHFSTEANNVALNSRELFLEEKVLCNSAFGEGTCNIPDGKRSGQQLELQVGKPKRKKKKADADAVTVAPSKKGGR